MAILDLLHDHLALRDAREIDRFLDATDSVDEVLPRLSEGYTLRQRSGHVPRVP